MWWPLFVAALLSVVLRFPQVPMRVATAVGVVAALVAFRVVPSPALLALVLAPAAWLLIGTAIAHRLLGPRSGLEHTWQHAVLGGATLGGFATSAAILKTSQDRRHGARLATLAWVAGAVSPLGGLGTVAVWRRPEWLLLGVPLLAASILLLRSQSRTAAIPPEYTRDRITPAVVAMGVAMLCLGSGGLWHVAERVSESTPLQLYGVALGATVVADPTVVALSIDNIQTFEPFANPWNGLALWLGLACTPVPVLILLFLRFGGNAVRDAKHVFIPLALGAAMAIAMTTSA